jgi:hypothetical protein
MKYKVIWCDTYEDENRVVIHILKEDTTELIPVEVVLDKPETWDAAMEAAAA